MNPRISLTILGVSVFLLILSGCSEVKNNRVSKEAADTVEEIKALKHIAKGESFGFEILEKAEVKKKDLSADVGPCDIHLFEGTITAKQDIPKGEYLSINPNKFMLQSSEKFVVETKRAIPSGTKIVDSDIEWKVIDRKKIPVLDPRSYKLPYIEDPLGDGEFNPYLSSKWHVLGRSALTSIAAHALVKQDDIDWEPTRKLLIKAAREIPRGQKIAAADLSYESVKTEATGEPPYFDVIGKTAPQQFKKGDSLKVLYANESK